MQVKMKEKQPGNQIELRSAINIENKPELLNEVLRVEAEAWPVEIRAPKEKFEARLGLFPEGFVLAYVDNKLAGVSTSEVINYDPSDPPTTWEGTTDNGFIRKSHQINGNAIYVVSVGVSGWAQGNGLGSKLLSKQKELAITKKLTYLVLGSRLPGYREFHIDNPEVSAEQYSEMKNDDDEPKDPEIRFYSRQGLKVARIVPNYMEDDPESEDYGAVMVWENV